MVTEKIRIAYDGKGLADGSMDIKDLAPALMAFGDLVVRINELVGDGRAINVMLKPDDVRKGSFDVSLDIVYSGIEQIKLFANAMIAGGASSVAAISPIINVLGWGQAITGSSNCSIFGLIKLLFGKKISKIEEKGNDVYITIENYIIPCHKDVFRVYKDGRARKNIADMLRPLTTEGISSFEMRNPDNVDDKTPFEKITKEDIPAFAVPEIGAVEQQPVTQSMVLKIVNLAFQDDNKWRFTDGNGNYYWMKIADEEFLKKVTNREVKFGSGDMLELEFVLNQKIYPDAKIVNDYTVMKIKQIISAPTQITLDFEK